MNSLECKSLLSCPEVSFAALAASLPPGKCRLQARDRSRHQDLCCFAFAASPGPLRAPHPASSQLAPCRYRRMTDCYRPPGNETLLSSPASRATGTAFLLLAALAGSSVNPVLYLFTAGDLLPRAGPRFLTRLFEGSGEARGGGRSREGTMELRTTPRLRVVGLGLGNGDPGGGAAKDSQEWGP
ncbi:PREDICTED: leukotriene B4 receptor 2-like [Myotis brandtii]|uniref:leukotriene B4 receptor 2-like n=1 Tax=Myotis brandtii TaxID=109478 RepID=UPI000703D41C|nr:PREDICTED: leukotriene B4 receptor 2-like [Myotis brandtii]